MELSKAAVPSLQRAPSPSLRVFASASCKVRFEPNVDVAATPKKWPMVPQYPKRAQMAPGCVLQ